MKECEEVEYLMTNNERIHEVVNMSIPERHITKRLPHSKFRPIQHKERTPKTKSVPITSCWQ